MENRQEQTNSDGQVQESPGQQGEMPISLKSNSRLVDNMAYQIRTFSNAIIGFSDLLLSESLTVSQMEYVNEIFQAGRGLSVLVNDVLDLAKLESGQLAVSYNNCDLAELLRNFYHAISPAAAQKGLAFHILAEPNVPSRMITDEERLYKCLIYIACNAVKFTNSGYIRVHLRLENRGKPCICFDIEDTGVGIAEERLKTIFDEVVKTEDANRGILSSLDMGLAVTGSMPVTKRLAEALGGWMQVASRAGVGSTFSLIMPAGLDPAAEQSLNLTDFELSQEKHDENKDSHPRSAKADSAASPASARHSGRVLLVEDQESNRMVISLLLETMGLEVATAENGQQAVVKALDEAFDIILMDLKLPIMDGYQATRTLRQSKLKTPVVALSAGVMSEQDHQNIKNDFNGYLVKPVDREKLYQTLKRFIPDLELNNGQDEKSPTAKGSDDAYSFEIELSE